jgi:cation diffusion facilitator CzcD-associated flavoprotein CzcO
LHRGSDNTFPDIEETVDKFGLRPFFHFNARCLGARWIEETRQWRVTFLDTTTKQQFTRDADMLLTAVGGFSEPRRVNFPGMDRFQGPIFHTAEWDHSYNYSGKRMAVIGNGCSAAQVVPNVANSVSKLTQ